VKSRISREGSKVRKKAVLDTSHSLTVRGVEKTVRLDRIRPNKWNPNRMSPFSRDKLRENMRAFGFIDPILVRSGNEDGPFPEGGYEIIDGEQRWTVAKEEKIKQVKITDLGNVSDESCKVLTVNFNDLRGKHDRDALAVIVGELAKLDGGDTLLDLLPYDPAEIDSLQTLNAADFDALDSLPPTENMTGSSTPSDEDEVTIEDVLELDRIKPRRAADIAARLEGLRDYLADNPQDNTQIDRPGGLLLALLDAAESHYEIEQAEEPEQAARKGGK
jgi:hypothetical protein